MFILILNRCSFRLGLTDTVTGALVGTHRLKLSRVCQGFSENIRKTYGKNEVHTCLKCKKEKLMQVENQKSPNHVLIKLKYRWHALLCTSPQAAKASSKAFLSPQAIQAGSQWATDSRPSPLKLCKGQFPQDRALQPDFSRLK